MAEILIVTWDGGGNVPPSKGIAHDLVSRGHLVRFLGHARQREPLETAGFEMEPSPRARPFSSLDEHSPLDSAAAFGDRGLAADVLAALARRPAGVVVVDCLLFGVLDALRRSGRAYVVLEHCYDAYFEQLVRGPMGLAMRLRGLRPGAALSAARARLVATHPDLDPNGAHGDRRGITFIGPVLPMRPALRHVEVPTMLVSLSTYRFSGMARSLQAILDACAGLDARVVVTTGPVIDPAELKALANAVLHRFVPHAELMSHATMLVGHGGHATTMQALGHDLPMLLMPMHPLLDQPMVARSVAGAGAGLVARKRAPAAELAPMVARLLADGPHRDAAVRLGEKVRSMPGGIIGADVVESVLGSGPVASAG